MELSRGGRCWGEERAMLQGEERALLLGKERTMLQGEKRALLGGKKNVLGDCLEVSCGLCFFPSRIIVKSSPATTDRRRGCPGAKEMLAFPL